MDSFMRYYDRHLGRNDTAYMWCILIFIHIQPRSFEFLRKDWFRVAFLIPIAGFLQDVSRHLAILDKVLYLKFRLFQGLLDVPFILSYLATLAELTVIVILSPHQVSIVLNHLFLLLLVVGDEQLCETVHLLVILDVLVEHG